MKISSSLVILMLKFSTLIAFLILCAAPLSAQLSPQQQELARYVRQNYTKREVMIAMRDGVKLFSAIYEPKERGKKYPILINRTPYRASPYGADNFKRSLGPSDLFTREGYIFVYQDVRGKCGSER